MTFRFKKEIRPFIHLIDDGRWEGPLGRSEEVTVLYVDRYTGPRHHDKLLTHEFWEFTYVMKGQGQLVTSDSSYTFRSGCGVLIPPGIHHYEYSTESVDTVWIGLTGTIIDRLEANIVIDENAEIAAWVKHLLVLNSKTFEKNGAQLDAIAKLILSHFIHQYHQTMPTKNNLDRIIHYINDHYNESLTVERMAQVMDLSTGYFQRLFKKNMKVSPYDYLLSVRIKQACWWLRQSSEKLGVISQHVGFNDPLYFSKCFKRITGKSPSGYRKELLTG
jgi:AraC-like DNA-binding protein/mannose-6-phosphate isomerase-like protein (cupin superfamily)